MNAAHAHLLLNHLPVLGILFTIPLLAFAWWHGAEILRRVALFAVVLAGGLALPAFLTGEPAEETVERMSGVSESAIESHEELAKFALSASLSAAVLAAVGLVLARRRGKTPGVVLAATVGVSCVAAVLMGLTANRGGQIRHSEIVGDASATGTAAPEAHEDDD
jgi:uncharacterized membrane protein